MRRKALGLAATLVPVMLSGCSALGLGGTATPATTTAPPGPVSGAGWIVGQTGSPTPSAPATRGGGARAGASLPPVSFLPMDPSCPRDATVEPVQIPMTITPGAGSLTVSWPGQHGSNYRITAVPQPLRSGSQPDPVWQEVAPATGCTVIAKIAGLTPKKPYVIWLDAPNSGYHQDGSRHPYAGESGVVYPK